MTRKILVGVEDAPTSNDAVLWAAHAAAARGWRLELVTATGWPTVALDVLYDDGVIQGANTLLETTAARVAEVAPGVTVGVEVDRRIPALALVERSREADLLVVGTHRLSAVERVFSGSLSYQIAAGAHCPVVVVTHLPGAEATGVVVGADGSADAVEAIALAAAEADWTGQDLHVVHAWQEPTTYAAADVFPLGVMDQVEQDERLVLAESVAGLAEQYPDLVVHSHLMHEQAATALLAVARRARLVVVGSRGRHGVARLLLGSVSHTVVLHAGCPVMVARTRTHARPAHS
ncbi:MAG TPA: universal stress protein [Actinotalea sp.]|nr:universal stress protein [Actinotalea sp.]